MEVYVNVIIFFIMDFARVSIATPYLACYSCIYNPALPEGITIMTTSPWLPRIRHQRQNHNVTMTSSKRRRVHYDVINTKRCDIHPGKDVTSMPIRICPKIEGYKEFCHREYTTDNSQITHVTRDCFYSNQRTPIQLSSEILDPVTMVIERRQKQLCSTTLCNQDNAMVAKFIENVPIATVARDTVTENVLTTIKQRILSRNKREELPLTTTPSNHVYNVDTEQPSNRYQGNDAGYQGDGDEDHGRFDEDSEDDGEDNYYNADGSGVNIEFSRWFPTDLPTSTAACHQTNKYYLLFIMAYVTTVFYVNSW